jgi:LPS export ABC transporter protein LptC
MLLMIAGSGALIATFVGYRYLSGGATDIPFHLPDNASLALSSIHHTATRNGLVEWQLDADSARYIDSKKEAILENPSVTFHSNQKKTITLTARQGLLNTDSKDIRVTDNVRMDHAAYALETDSLYYQHDARTISSETPVKLSGDAFEVRADTMVFDLNTDQTLFQGRIEGTLREKI